MVWYFFLEACDMAAAAGIGLFGLSYSRWIVRCTPSFQVVVACSGKCVYWDRDSYLHMLWCVFDILDDYDFVIWFLQSHKDAMGEILFYGLLRILRWTSFVDNNSVHAQVAPLYIVDVIHKWEQSMILWLVILFKKDKESEVIFKKNNYTTKHVKSEDMVDETILVEPILSNILRPTGMELWAGSND